jgi:hypothetical protein
VGPVGSFDQTPFRLTLGMPSPSGLPLPMHLFQLPSRRRSESPTRSLSATCCATHSSAGESARRVPRGALPGLSGATAIPVPGPSDATARGAAGASGIMRVRCEVGRRDRGARLFHRRESRLVRAGIRARQRVATLDGSLSGQAITRRAPASRYERTVSGVILP